MSANQHLGTVEHAWRVIPCRHSHQDGVGTGSQPAEHRGSPFARYCIYKRIFDRYW